METILIEQYKDVSCKVYLNFERKRGSIYVANYAVLWSTEEGIYRRKFIHIEDAISFVNELRANEVPKYKINDTIAVQDKVEKGCSNIRITKEQQDACNALYAIDGLKTLLKGIGLETTMNNEFDDGTKLSFDMLEAIDEVVKGYARIIFNKEST